MGKGEVAVPTGYSFGGDLRVARLAVLGAALCAVRAVLSVARHGPQATENQIQVLAMTALVLAARADWSVANCAPLLQVLFLFHCDARPLPGSEVNVCGRRLVAHLQCSRAQGGEANQTTHGSGLTETG